MDRTWTGHRGVNMYLRTVFFPESMRDGEGAGAGRISVASG